MGKVLTRRRSRPFTLADAQRALPLIRSIARDAHATYLRVRQRLQEYDGSHSLDEISSDHSLPLGVREDLSELRGFVRELDELGARLGEPELGIVILAGRVGSRRVNLCWKLGEERIRYWYPVDGTYEDRRPIPGI